MDLFGVFYQKQSANLLDTKGINEAFCIISLADFNQKMALNGYTAHFVKNNGINRSAQ